MAAYDDVEARPAQEEGAAAAAAVGQSVDSPGSAPAGTSVWKCYEANENLSPVMVDLEVPVGSDDDEPAADMETSENAVIENDDATLKEDSTTAKPKSRCCTRRLAKLSVLTTILCVLAAGCTVGGAMIFYPDLWAADDEVVVRVSGYEVDEGDVNVLLDDMEAGKTDFTVQLVDQDTESNSTLQVHVASFDGLAAAMKGAEVRNGTTQRVLMINEETGGFTVGNTSMRALVCDGEGMQVSKCVLKSEAPRSLLSDNEADVIKHAITVAVIGAVVITCIFACSAAFLSAAPAIAGAVVTAGCFPGRATVQALGGPLAVRALFVGTAVLTSSGFSPMLLSGHNDAAARTLMLHLTTASNHTLAVTPDHYLPLPGGIHKSAGNIVEGDELLIQATEGFQPSLVVGVNFVEEEGLFNPYTVAGDLVVDGVLASCHSSWFLEGLFDDETKIVQVYEQLFAPLRIMFHLAPAWFARFEQEMADEPKALNEVGVIGIVASALSAFFKR